MTQTDRDHLGRAEALEHIVDELDRKVAGEREAAGVPGKPSDRDHAAARGSETEPPD